MGILTRLRIGHSNITHSHLLKGDEPPYCIPCQEPYTIKHILSNCLDLKQIRQKLYKETKLSNIFLPTNITKIFKYLKETKIYNKIKPPLPYSYPSSKIFFIFLKYTHTQTLNIY